MLVDLLTRYSQCKLFKNSLSSRITTKTNVTHNPKYNHWYDCYVSVLINYAKLALKLIISGEASATSGHAIQIFLCL